MTLKVYLTDAYAKEADANITAINSNEVEFDKTVFYPTGGGQLHDTGEISINGVNYKVNEVKKDGDRVIHVLDRPIDANVGDAVHLKIDWDRRYAHMRYHTALHVLDGILENHEAGKQFNAAPGAITGGQIYHNRARIDFDMEGFSREKAQQLLDITQKFIDEGHAIYVKFLTREEADKMPNLARTEPGRELLKKLTEIRIVGIDGLDAQLDGGTHVSNTKEIGKMTLTNYESKGSRRKRIEIVLS
ncbi:MAG: alanyl-tRNA editing protein [Candidatus Micrarchaeota archaeon]|nr:alanyl-tRNA editing protein [Candidatus Micrarchaeota archaeon]